MATLIDTLRDIVGPAHVLTEESDVAPYVVDWRGRYRGTAICVVRPASVEQLARVVRCCHDANVAMVPQGGNTGLCGGATPTGSEIVVSLARMHRVRAVDIDNNTITVEAGCTLQAVQEAAADAGRLFPLSIASEGTATVGGCLSTNAGGVQVLRYGNARELVLGIEAVLPDGQVWEGLRGLRKDNTGYDLKQLFIGAEGTLGFITAAVLKLFPAPRSVATAWVAVESPEHAVRLLTHLRGTLGERVTAFELIGEIALQLVLQHIPDSRLPLQQASPWHVLVELSDPALLPLDDMLADALAAFDATNAVIAHDEAQRNELWRLRENISEAQKREGFSIKHDVSVPVSNIATFVATADAALTNAYPGIRIVCFGHIGDGNLHYNQSMPVADRNGELIKETPQINRIVHDIVHACGGSISAEHGLGQLKREEIKRYKSGLEIDLMRNIKKALDPRGLMNPGKVI